MKNATKKRFLAIVTLMAMLTTGVFQGATPARAALTPGGAVGPTNPTTGFPQWYRDQNGLALDLMEAADAFGISDPVDPANQFSQQIGFNAEGFYWSADAVPTDTVNTVTSTPVSGILVLAMEAAFAGEAAVDGEQSTFGRVRYRIDGLTPGASYTVDHPFGSATEVADAAGVINTTNDIGGFGVPGFPANFNIALASGIGPFLTWDTFNANPTLQDPVLINPANPGRVYVGNPNIAHAVTGGTNGNTFSVSGSGLTNYSTNLFTVTGRLADVTPPVITVTGANPATVAQGTAYVDAGATALDDINGDVTANIVVTGDTFDTNIIGTNTVTYTVSDTAGNTATATRTVNVAALGLTATNDTATTPVDTPAVIPAATLTGNDTGGTAPITVTSVQGAVNGTVSLAGGNVTFTPTAAFSGAASFTYTITDSAVPTPATATGTVNVTVGAAPVADTTPPTITVTGANPASVQVGTAYTDAGATAIDNVDPTVNVVTTGLPINTTTAGTFTVTYTATDVAGNIATTTRTVNVTAAPGGGTPVTPAAGVAPVITSAYVSGIAKSAVAITFTTDIPSLGFVTSTKDKRFRKGFSVWSDPNGLSTTHTVVAGRLKKKTKYSFQMMADDGTGKQIRSGVFVVKTAKR